MHRWTSPDENSLATTQMAQIRQALLSRLMPVCYCRARDYHQSVELSERFATTRITLKEALAALEAEGKIYREERRGWFVASARFIYDPR